jgi:hypothetical protein
VADPLPDLVTLYDRRMTPKEQFRDTKDWRFGVRLEWTHFRTPAPLARFRVLLGDGLGAMDSGRSGHGRDHTGYPVIVQG